MVMDIFQPNPGEKNQKILVLPGRLGLGAECGDLCPLHLPADHRVCRGLVHAGSTGPVAAAPAATPTASAGSAAPAAASVLLFLSCCLVDFA